MERLSRLTDHSMQKNKIGRKIPGDKERSEIGDRKFILNSGFRILNSGFYSLASILRYLFTLNFIRFFFKAKEDRRFLQENQRFLKLP